MHELAITESIVAAVCERVGSSRVTRVVVEIGGLSGVVPEALHFCFDLCAKGTALEGSELDVVSIPGRGRCGECGEERELEGWLSLCRCGSADLELLRGRELRVREVEVI